MQGQHRRLVRDWGWFMFNLAFGVWRLGFQGLRLTWAPVRIIGRDTGDPQHNKAPRGVVGESAGFWAVTHTYLRLSGFFVTEPYIHIEHDDRQSELDR